MVGRRQCAGVVSSGACTGSHGHDRARPVTPRGSGGGGVNEPLETSGCVLRALSLTACNRLPPHGSRGLQFSASVQLLGCPSQPVESQSDALACQNGVWRCGFSRQTRFFIQLSLCYRLRADTGVDRRVAVGV
jgi:hypothetical protein